MEDIDALQMELEAMLSSTVVRKMTLKEELDVLFDIDKYKGRGKLNRKVIQAVLCLHGSLTARFSK